MRTVVVVTSQNLGCMVVRTLTDELSALQSPLTAKVVNDSENGAAFFLRHCARAFEQAEAAVTVPLLTHHNYWCT